MARLRLLLLLLSAAAILLREPRLVLEPRLWGEDGTNFYRFAFQNSLLDALLYLPVNGPGYYSFAEDAAAAFAVAVVRPEGAAAVFLWLSLLVQLSPLVVVLFGRSYVWNTPLKQAVVCALVVFSPAAGIEMWLNLVIAMNHFGLAALCVAMEDYRGPVSRARAWTHRAILLVGGLTGPWVVALTPLFAIKVWRERSREAKLQLGILLATCVVQGTVVLLTLSQGALDRERSTGSPPAMMLNVAAVHHVLRPLAGLFVDDFVQAADLRPALRPVGDAAVYARGLLLLLPGLLGVLVLLLPPPSTWQRWALLGGFLLSSGVASFGAYGVATGRYGFIPGLLVALILVDNLGPVATTWQRVRRALSALVLAFTLAMGVAEWHEYRGSEHWESDYPAWADEVALWRADPGHVLAGTPASFDVDLQRRGLARDLKQALQGLVGVVLASGGREEVLLPVQGIPSFGRLLVEVETDAPADACALTAEFVLADGEVLAQGQLVNAKRRSVPGRLAFVDHLPRPRGVLRVAALRIRLAPGSGSVTIRRARYGDELLFF